MIFFNLFVELFFKNKDLNKKIRFDFFNQHCFSLPHSANYDRFIGLRQFKRLIYKLWFSKKTTLINNFSNSNSASYLYDISIENIQVKSNYVNKEAGDSISGAFARNDFLFGLSIFNRILISVLSLMIYPFISFLVFFKKKNRINIALLPELLIECSILINLLLKVDCEKIYFFSTHEPEANLLAHLLMKKNIKVVKIPNSNPLFMFNKNMVTDELILTLEYQFEEANLFYEDCDFEIKRWHPIGLNKYYNINKENQSSKKLCYYSHASWIRKSEDHHLPKFNEVELELNFLELIRNSNFFSNHEVYICLHPKEKTSSNILIKSKNYYKKIFGSNVQFYNNSSFESFEEFELGFGAFSSILFERIHCGYKTLIFNNLISEFPILNSDFNYFVMSDFENLLESIQCFVNENFDELTQRKYKYV